MIPTVSSKGVTNTGETTTKKGNVLGKDDFLQLLVLQLRTQNPLEPMDSQEFSAQLAQFSALEAMQNVQKSLENLLLLQAGSLVGKEVSLQGGISGTVEGVVIKSDRWLVVVGGEEYSLDEIIKVGM